MRIRNVLVAVFLFATLVPSAIYGLWSYNYGVNREFSEVNDRHLLIAENLSIALSRYHTDVVTTFETISQSLIQGDQKTDFDQLLKNMHLSCIVLINASTGQTVDGTNAKSAWSQIDFKSDELKMIMELATENQSRFSAVTSANGSNVMYLVRRYGDMISLAYVGTDYFVELGKSISFGERGHAAIVDHEGNVLAHPLPDWVETRKNISKVSAVRRMMNGETGIEQFYSPALKGDMIAGLTTVKGPGWGIMVPQPVSEIFDKVHQNNTSILAAIGLGLAITLVCVMVLVNSLAAPLERLARVLRSNSRGEELQKTPDRGGLVPVKELREFNISYNRMVDRVKSANSKITGLAYTDTVTALPNREKFQSVVTETLAACKEGQSGGVLIFVDLDNFKEINDIHGHDVGDDFLRACAKKLTAVCETLDQESLTATPTVARIGGDEFTILIPGIVELNSIEKVLDELRFELSKPSDDMGFIATCSASFGCVQYPGDGTTVEELIRNADIAMYQAKRKGKNTAEIYSSTSGERTAAEIRRDLIIAIDENQLTLEYQPKVCTQSNEVMGVEALVRWRHPELGFMMPNDWLPAINNSPAIASLGTWVVNQAMRDQIQFAEAGHDMHVSINIGSKHFISTGFIECLEAAAMRNKFDRSKLEIEITEDAIFGSETRAEVVLNSLHKLGYTISIDDFGKGYSNIVRFAQLPVDVIKIDRSIVVNASTDPRIKTIMKSTIDMAHDLDCKIVAEGIETLQQAQFVTSLGTDLLQGHYYTSSKCPGEMIKWINASKQNEVIELQESLTKIAV